MDKVEKLLREHVRSKILELITKRDKSERPLREAIRKILKEGDVSDIHPHRSTAINILEDVLKKAIPTLRTDYKRLTTEKSQRDSFRAHILKAIEDALAPSLVNWKYLSGQEGGGGLMSEPPSDDIKSTAGDEEIDSELEALEEADIEVDIADDGIDGLDVEKKVPVEADDEQSPEEDFGSGLEEMDETGRNMGYTSFRKISQYILDAYDTLANGKDKEVFVDYLLTNIKLYFDKFEDELQKSVSEPESPEYQKPAQ
jgi:hypothetical protein|tara:strand:+ start:1016 stop:1786 length:771 start_codon:yes stop_codon:yes gene_type:complete